VLDRVHGWAFRKRAFIRAVETFSISSLEVAVMLLISVTIEVMMPPVAMLDTMRSAVVLQGHLVHWSVSRCLNLMANKKTWSKTRPGVSRESAVLL